MLVGAIQSRNSEGHALDAAHEEVRVAEASVALRVRDDLQSALRGDAAAGGNAGAGEDVVARGVGVDTHGIPVLAPFGSVLEGMVALDRGQVDGGRRTTLATVGALDRCAGRAH